MVLCRNLALLRRCTCPLDVNGLRSWSITARHWTERCAETARGGVDRAVEVRSVLDLLDVIFTHWQSATIEYLDYVQKWCLDNDSRSETASNVGTVSGKLLSCPAFRQVVHMLHPTTIRHAVGMMLVPCTQLPLRLRPDTS